jgi:hypothetical protein
MADLLHFTTSDLKELEDTSSMWFNVPNDTNSDDFTSLLFDDKAFEEITTTGSWHDKLLISKRYDRICPFAILFRFLRR